jgi:fructokinase
MSATDDRVIVVAGEALVDLVLGATDELRGHPGGGPFNVARTLGRLEQPVAYLGRISTDRFGRRMRDELEADGVRLDAVVATDDPTTLALAEVGAGGSATYRFYTDGTSAPGLTAQEARSALPERVDTLHVGTLGLVLEPIATTLEELVAEAAEDTMVVMDPNCRPTAIPDPAAYRGRLGRMLPRCDVVKVSEEDLEFLEPGRSPVEAARALVAGGAPVVLVTRGGDGALVVTAEERIPVSAPPAEVVDTIGAGDAFGGGFLAWWRLRGLHRADVGRLDAVVQATEFACLVAARTCERPGAAPPRLAELPV